MGEFQQKFWKTKMEKIFKCLFEGLPSITYPILWFFVFG